MEICLARRPMSTKLSKRPANLRSGLPPVGRRLMVGFEDETERGKEEEDMEEEEESMAGTNDGPRIWQRKKRIT